MVFSSLRIGVNDASLSLSAIDSSGENNHKNLASTNLKVSAASFNALSAAVLR